MCRVGFGVSEKACFNVSSCFAFIVVLGPLLLVPGVFSSLPTELPLVPGAVLFDPLVKPGELVLPLDPMVPFGEPAHLESVNAWPESERDEDADMGDDFDERPISEPDPPEDVKGGKLV